MQLVHVLASKANETGWMRWCDFSGTGGNWKKSPDKMSFQTKYKQ